MNISFDFDGVLSEPHMQKVAVNAMLEGHNVCVTTARFEHPSMPFINKDVWKTCEQLGIYKHSIRFTNGTEKSKLLAKFDAHFDDCLITLDEIRQANKSIKLYYCHENRHVYDFDEFDVKVKRSEAGIIYYE
jgi:valyl-tRNA synthetase